MKELKTLEDRMDLMVEVITKRMQLVQDITHLLCKLENAGKMDLFRKEFSMLKLDPEKIDPLILEPENYVVIHNIALYFSEMNTNYMNELDAIIRDNNLFFKEFPEAESTSTEEVKKSTERYKEYIEELQFVISAKKAFDEAKCQIMMKYLEN